MLKYVVCVNCFVHYVLCMHVCSCMARPLIYMLFLCKSTFSESVHVMCSASGECMLYMYLWFRVHAHVYMHVCIFVIMIRLKQVLYLKLMVLRYSVVLHVIEINMAA